jgi:hypothetical protein
MGAILKTKKRNIIVVPRTRAVINKGLDIEGYGHIDFKGKTAANVTDPGLAAAIEQKYGLSASGPNKGDVWTERDERADHAVTYHDGVGRGRGVHNYFFAPSKTYSEEWERIFNKEKQNG